jgi:hypothetical protein
MAAVHELLAPITEDVDVMAAVYEPPMLVDCGAFADQTHGAVGVVHEVTGYFYG